MQVFSFSFTFDIMHFLLAMKNASVQLSTDHNQQARRKKEVPTPALTTQNQTESERNFDAVFPVVLSVLTDSVCAQSSTAFIGKTKAVT